ncbi:MAG: hypothetical protein ACYDCW_09590 [Acidithiobacillus ferrivorans]
MGFTLDKVVPWGRSYDEYVSMFGLSEDDLTLRILGCGDGPAAFNSLLTKCGGSVTSVDPIYAFDAAQIRTRVAEAYDIVMTQARKNQGNYQGSGKVFCKPLIWHYSRCLRLSVPCWIRERIIVPHSSRLNILNFPSTKQTCRSEHAATLGKLRLGNHSIG